MSFINWLYVSTNLTLNMNYEFLQIEPNIVRKYMKRFLNISKCKYKRTNQILY